MSGVATAVVASAVIGGVVASNSAKKQAQATKDANQAQIDANAVDPRVTNMLFGSGTKDLKAGVTPNWSNSYNFGTGQSSQVMTNPASDYTTDNGLLGQWTGMLDTPQALGAKQYGQANDNYVGAFTAHDLEAARGGATKLLAGDTAAPTMQAASSAATQINAPAQNSMDLTGSYNSLINGEAGANPYLTGAIQKGINQSNTAFENMVTDATQATKDTLGGIRGNSVLAGQYGGSRQGIAEGKAIESMNTQLGRAASQVGQNNTDAAVAAQASAYDSDMNRKLSATTSLSGQQYGNAAQNAAMTQQNNQFNAGLLQNAGQTNLGAQVTTNAQNAQNTQAGIAGIGGLLTQASGAAGAQDMYDVNKNININQGLLSPYLNKNATPTTLTPVYNNSSASALGGAMAGAGTAANIANLFKKTDA